MSQPTIVWRLVPRPDLGRVAWEATSVCPHGDAAYTVFGKPEVLLEQAAGLARTHQMAMECACTLGSFTFEGEAP